MPESTAARLKTIGLLIRHSREAAGRSIKDCAAFIGITPALMGRYEEGSREPSLVELEALAHYLQIPVRALLDGSESEKLTVSRRDVSMAEVGKLRTHIIGTLLRQARLKMNESVQHLAETVDLKASKLQSYELGRRPIPITELERLIACLDIPLDSLLDIGIGPLGHAQLYLKQQALFDALPDDLRTFVTDRGSLPYLRAAMRLRQLPADELKNTGRVLLELVE